MSFEDQKGTWVFDTMLEKEHQEKQLTDLLNSRETLEAIRDFSEKHRELVIGLIVEFWILFPNISDVRSYLQQIRDSEECLDSHYTMSQKKVPLLIENIAKFLNLEEITSDESADKVVQYVSERFFTNGFVFHSFNGAFSQSIHEHGLETSIRIWDWEELKGIMGIGRDVGTPMLLGWGGINSESKTSIGDEVQHIYRYGVVSPEWFAQFVCEGAHIGANPPYDKFAFHKRNYAAARRNIDAWIQKNTLKDESLIAQGREYRNLTELECTTIITFFEKYWAKFAGEKSGPKLTLIPRRLVQQGTSGVRSYTEFRDESWEKQGTLEDCVDTLLTSVHPDRQIQHSVPATELRCIDLPGWKDIFSNG